MKDAMGVTMYGFSRLQDLIEEEGFMCLILLRNLKLKYLKCEMGIKKKRHHQ